MSATTPALLRIGELAKLAGTTPRTIRYYEEKGLLPLAGERRAGAHRLYDAEDAERLRDVLRLKELLGLSLEELKELVAAADERALLRSEFRRTESPARRERILRRLDAYAARQLELIERRSGELGTLRDEVLARRARIAQHLAAVDMR
jgi:DNA-binding transcriptional MerR regulator